MDLSFDFLLKTGTRVPRWIAEGRLCFLWFLAGFIDAEGSIGIVFHLMYGRWQVKRPYLSIANTNWGLMKHITALTKSDFSRLRLNHKSGTPTSRGGAVRSKDGWELIVTRRTSLRKLLESLPIHHMEKVAKCALALKVLSGAEWNETRDEYQELKSEIKKQVTELATLAAERLHMNSSSESR